MSNKSVSPFIMKIRFYDSTHRNQKKNQAHISYIAKRSGVEKHEYEVEPKDGNSDDLGTAAGHVKYAHERPGSHGLFGEGVDGSLETMKAVQSELRNHEGIVWRMVLSLREEDAQRLDMITRKDWEEKLKASMSDAAHHMGISESNFRWVAAFHDEPGHPHVHVVFWEKSPKRTKGVLSHGEKTDLKKTFMREIYGQERLQLQQDKTLMRDYIREFSKNELIDTVNIIRDLRKYQEEIHLNLDATNDSNSSIAPRVSQFTENRIVRDIQKLAEILPSKGRMVMKFMPEEVKTKANQIASTLIKHPDLKKSLDKYNRSIEGMVRHYTMDNEKITQSIQNGYEDIQKRVAQLVIKAAMESQKNNFMTITDEKAKKTVEILSKAKGRVDSDVLLVSKLEDVLKSTTQSLRNLGFNNEEQYHYLLNWREKVQLDISHDKLLQLIKQTNFKEMADKQTTKDAQKNLDVVTSVLRLGGMSNEDIELVFQNKKIVIDEPDFKSYLARNERVLRDNQNGVLSDSEWTRICSNTNVNVENPWEVKETKEIIGRSEAIAAFRNAGLMDKDKDAGWFAFTMNLALKQLNVDDAERKEILIDWIDRNQAKVSNINGILENQEMKSLSKHTWETLCKALDMKFEYPWVTRKELNFDREKFSNAMKEFEICNGNQSLPKDEVLWTIKTYASLLEHDSDKLKENALREFSNKFTELTEKQFEKITMGGKSRLQGIDIMRRKIEGVIDRQSQVVTNFAKTLLAAGLEKEEITKVISDWNQRSKSNIEFGTLTKAIESAWRSNEQIAGWGRTTVINKEEFKNLCNHLQVQAPYMWKHEKNAERNFHSNIFSKLWNTMWFEIQKEKNSQEAKLELLKRRKQRQVSRNKDREKEQEQE